MTDDEFELRDRMYSDSKDLIGKPQKGFPIFCAVEVAVLAEIDGHKRVKTV